jgi:hypothetical protein
MPMVTLHKVGEGNLYHMHVLDPHDPGFGGGRPQPPDPGYGGGRPGGRPDNTLPGGGHISNRPPGSGGGGIPDHELPESPPPNVAPGWTLVLIRHEGKWAYAVIAPGSPPPRPLPPGPPDHIANRPPGSGGPDLPSQGLPGGPNYPTGGPVPPPGGPTYPTGQPVPPPGTAQPKA